MLERTVAYNAASAPRSVWVTDLGHHFHQRVEQFFRGVRPESAGAEPGLIAAPGKVLGGGNVAEAAMGPFDEKSGLHLAATKLQSNLAERLAGPICNTCNGTDTLSSRSTIPRMRRA